MARLKRVNDMMILDGIMKEQENTKVSKETKPNSFLGSVMRFWVNWRSLIYGGVCGYILTELVKLIVN
tara:strand:- start:9 stop:212 length:204 start_codon:yes stop_codon:yes gene_type:complete